HARPERFRRRRAVRPATAHARLRQNFSRQSAADAAHRAARRSGAVPVREARDCRDRRPACTSPGCDMKLLAIDTATERCSVALRIDDRSIERATETQRGHADLVLPMVDAVLAEAGLTLRQLDGLAYGRGPGGFTGVRIAVGVAQGL